MRLVNLTDHEVSITGSRGRAVILPAALPEQVIRNRLRSRHLYDLVVDGEGGEQLSIPVMQTWEEPPTNPPLPAPVDGVVYLVSRRIAQMVNRGDVLCPNDS